MTAALSAADRVAASTTCSACAWHTGRAQIAAIGSAIAMRSISVSFKVVVDPVEEAPLAQGGGGSVEELGKRARKLGIELARGGIDSRPDGLETGNDHLAFGRQCDAARAPILGNRHLDQPELLHFDESLRHRRLRDARRTRQLANLRAPCLQEVRDDGVETGSEGCLEPGVQRFDVIVEHGHECA